MEKLQFALVGAGEFGNFAESVLDKVPEMALIAVVDTNEQAGKRLAEKYHAAVFHSVDDLLKSKKVDFVMINTPNDTHYQIINQALAGGIGVFCEKPLVIHKEQVTELFQLARPGQLDVDMVLRESKGYQYLKDRASTLPMPRRIHLENHAHESTIQAAWYWDDQRSGGWFYTSAIHFLDIIYFLWPNVAFDHYRAMLDIDSASGRAIGYEFGLKGPDTEVSVVHRFDTKGPEHVEGTIDFADDTVKINGWVPTDMQWQKSSEPPFQLGYDREVEYRQMVARRLKGFILGLKQQKWHVEQAEVYRTSYVCELLQSAALTQPNQWLALPELKKTPAKAS